MTRFDRSEKANINLEAHSFPRNLNSLVHAQEALRHCMLSNTRHRSSGLTFASRDSRILRQSLCKCIVRGNQADKGMNRRTELIGQTSPRDRQDLYHLHRQTKRWVTVRNESERHNNTDEIHVVVVGVDCRDKCRCDFNDAFIHVIISHATSFAGQSLGHSTQNKYLHNGISTSTSAESTPSTYLRCEQGI